MMGESKQCDHEDEDTNEIRKRKSNWCVMHPLAFICRVHRLAVSQSARVWSASFSLHVVVLSPAISSITRANNWIAFSSEPQGRSIEQEAEELRRDEERIKGRSGREDGMNCRPLVLSVMVSYEVGVGDGCREKINTDWGRREKESRNRFTFQNKVHFSRVSSCRAAGCSRITQMIIVMRIAMILNRNYPPGIRQRQFRSTDPDWLTRVEWVTLSPSLEFELVYQPKRHEWMESRRVIPAITPSVLPSIAPPNLILLKQSRH